MVSSNSRSSRKSARSKEPPLSAGQAARNATAEHLAEMRRLLDAAAESLDDDEEEEIAADDGIIEYRDGVFRLNPELALAGGREDPELRALVDSVLGGDAESK